MQMLVQWLFTSQRWLCRFCLTFGPFAVRSLVLQEESSDGIGVRELRRNHAIWVLDMTSSLIRDNIGKIHLTGDSILIHQAKKNRKSQMMDLWSVMRQQNAKDEKGILWDHRDRELAETYCVAKVWNREKLVCLWLGRHRFKPWSH